MKITKEIINAVLHAYLECVLFTESDSDNGIDQTCDIDDFSPSTIKTARREITAFLYLFKDALACAMENNPSYTWENVGHDIWYSRNGHGLNFWDRELGSYYGYAIGELTATCQLMGAQHAFYDGDIEFIILERG